MIEHVVTWTLKDVAAGAPKADNLTRMKAMLDDCADCVAGILAYQVVLPEPGRLAHFDIALYSVFAAPDALAAYNEHAKHLALKGFVGGIREARQCEDRHIDALESPSAGLSSSACARAVSLAIGG